ncbi:hypothetical protein [Gilvibacter sp.]|uniref:hypothetical protein n=1 Tax=Gilvibacter sp. TaxID=2729997 RepID=UPI0025B92D97|nr:hypothetical protein [Gilvibacter sp.]NQX76411.1 hypothetical protein [Gilvibacter sp.]
MIRKYWYILLLVFVLGGCSESDLPADNTDDSGQTDDTTDDSGQTADFEGVVDWQFTYGGSGDDIANAVVTTTDGGFAVLGYTQSNDGDITDKTATDSDYWVLKLDANGAIIWSRTYGGSSDDRGADIIETTDGGFAVAGFSRSSDGDATENAGFQDYWIVKLSASGDVQWQQSYGFAGSDQASSVIQTTDGGYFVSGFLDITASGGAGNDGFASAPSAAPKHGVGEFWGMRLDANGQLIWRRFFGGTNNDRSYQVLQTQDGGFLMTGASESDDFDVTNPKGSYDYWAVKINDSGDLVWEKSFGGSEIDIAYGLVESAPGTYVMVGDSRSADGDVSSPKGNADLWAVAFDSSGNFLWEESYGGSLFESARAVNQMGTGELIMAGTTRSSDGQVGINQGQNDAWVIMTTASGSLVWQDSRGGSGVELFNDCAPIGANALIVVGDTDSSDGDISLNKGGKDALIVKYK